MDLERIGLIVVGGIRSELEDLVPPDGRDLHLSTDDGGLVGLTSL
jgi:hypothetical protein